MEKREYEASYLLEDNYWWFKGQRAIVIDLLTSNLQNNKPVILDAGCGTGKNLETIRSTLSRTAFGFDLSADTLSYLRRRSLNGYVTQASMNSIPLADDTFDAIICLGVFECEEVDERSAYGELWRVVKPGGSIILVVSAYQWLLAPHDLPIHAVRRYNRSSVLRIFKEKPTVIKRMTYLYPILFPLVAALRLLSRWGSKSKEIPEASDLRPIPGWANKMLFLIVEIERIVLRGINFPFGSSLLVILQKPIQE